MQGRLFLLLALLAAPAAAQLPILPQPDPTGAPIRERAFVTAESAGIAWWGAFDTWTRAYVNLDARAGSEIVAANDDGRTFVFAGDGRILARHLVERPTDSPLRDLNGAVAGDVDADGRMDLVLATSTGTTVRLATRATPSGVELTPVWTVRLGPMDAPATLADVDGDGTLESFLQADGQAGHYALAADGDRRWTSDAGDGNAAPLVVDLDGDGDLEAVFGTDGGMLHAYDAATGTPLWKSRIPASPGSVPVQPVAFDLDGDGDQEVVVAARNIAQGGTDWIARSHAVVAAFDADGKERWSFTADWLNPLVGAAPVIADVNGDGSADILYVDWNTPGHKPGNWERLPDSHAFALDAAGRLLWMHAFPAYWSNRAPLVLDVTGDARPEVVLVDDRDGRSGILLLSLDGKEQARYPLRAGWIANRGAEAADLDGDGKLELVVPMARDATGCPWSACREGALLVLSTRGASSQLEAPAPPVGRLAPAPPPAVGRPPAPNDTAAATGAVSGLVTDAAGAAIPGAGVRIDGAQVASTDAEGRFAATVAVGRRTVTVEAAGYATQAVSVDVPAGGERALRVTLHEESAVVRGAPGWGVVALAAIAAAVAALRRPR